MVIVREAGCRPHLRSAVDDETIFARLDSTRRELVELVRDSLQAVRLLDAELTGPRDDRVALCKERGHCEDRDLIDEARHDLGAERCAMELRRLDANVSCRLAAAHALVLQRNLGAHRLEDIEDARARRIDADVLEEQVASRHDGSRDEPVGRRADVARDLDG